jgi:cyclophilin family peptidyl-prolyl cis-trans isomerase
VGAYRGSQVRIRVILRVRVDIKVRVTVRVRIRIRVRVNHNHNPNPNLARFQDLMETNFFNGQRFFRVIKGFMVQFGINGDPLIQNQWKGKTIKG